MSGTALPLLGLRIAAGPIELRGITDDLIGPLADLVVEGIDAPGAPAFQTPWETGAAQDLPRYVAQHYWRQRAEFRPDRWWASLAVLWDGTPAGVQGLWADEYAVTRTAATESWLARRFQGQGIGTAMRQVIAAFAFDYLDARQVTSSAFADSAASVAVSRKVGYAANGVHTWARDGQPVTAQSFRLSPEGLVRYQHPLLVVGVAAFRRSVGLDG